MGYTYSSRIFARFKVLDKAMYPIAIKGIPISLILRIFSIFLMGVFSLNEYDGYNVAFIRNVHIVLLASVIYTFLIYADDIDHQENYLFYIFGIIVIIFNIGVITNPYESASDKENILLACDSLSLFFLSFSLLFISDKKFYANYLRYTSVPKGVSKIFALTKSLIYGKDNFEDFEISGLLHGIGSLYKQEGLTIYAKRADDAVSNFNSYNNLFKSLTGVKLDAHYTKEFENAEDLLRSARYDQDIH